MSLSKCHPLFAVSPINGRYQSKMTEELGELYFGEYAWIKKRVEVEIKYVIALSDSGNCGKDFPPFSDEQKKFLHSLYADFTLEDAQTIKTIERKLNHDVKAVEVWIRDVVPARSQMRGSVEFPEWDQQQNFVHFGATSNDINNTAIPALLQSYIRKELIPLIVQVIDYLDNIIAKYGNQPFPTRTHGQTATPTLLANVVGSTRNRIAYKLAKLAKHEQTAKFGGATGLLNAHYVAYPDVDWHEWMDEFIMREFGLEREQLSKQTSNYDAVAELCHLESELSTIVLELAKDVWSYVSLDYFKLKTVEEEVGSSAMPQKLNPIFFENAEGNVGWAREGADYFAKTLPDTRMQRDLSDSTLLRNLGVFHAHLAISLDSLCRGFSRLDVNVEKMNEVLEDSWCVVAEAYQTILRTIGFDDPYNALKLYTRGKAMTRELMHEFVHSLEVSEEVKQRLLKITPHNFVGVLPKPKRAKLLQ